MIEGLENVTKADSCRSTKIDCNNAVEEYIKQEDWRIKANANTGYSSAGLVNNLAGKVIANYWLDKVYNKKEGDAHRSGDYHIHDLDILGAYCCGHDLQRLLKEGFNGVAGRVGSHAPKHVREALYQMANFIGILQSEWAGAQAFSSFDTFLAPLVFFDMVYDGLSEDDLKKAVRNFVYNLNVPSRWGQSPFSNVTLDLKCPNDLKKQLPMRGDEPLFVSVAKEVEKNENWRKMVNELRNRMGSDADGLDDDTMLFNVNYSLFEPEIKKIAKAYYEVLNEGDAYGVPFTFPIPTINITEDFNWDDPDYEVIWENTAKYGSSYFQNFIGSQYMRDEDGNLTVRDENAYSPNDVRSMAFLGTQQFVYRDKYGRISKNEIRHLVKNWIRDPEKNRYEFLINGEFHNVSEMFEIDYSSYDRHHHITLKNGYTVNFSVDHKCSVWENGTVVTKLSQDVKPGDKFVIAKRGWNVKNDIGTYEAGKIVGYYLAEGWNDGGRTIFCININREDIVEEIVNFFTYQGIEVNVTRDEEHHAFGVTAYGVSSCEYFKHFVKGERATEKRLNFFLWNTSDDFRKGVYDGYLNTDGSIKANNFAHTTNESLCEDLIVLGSSIGKIFNFVENPNNTRYFKKDKSDLVHFTSYKLELRQFEETEDFYLVEVSSNKEVFSRAKKVYNFTIDTPEHLVELPSGIISHQCCRLQLDKKQLRKRGGGLFGADAQTGSIGVVTINMARLGYLYKGKSIKLLIKRLYHLMDLAKSTLEKKRTVIKELNSRGLFPYTSRYVRSFDTFFSTIGINGMNECIRNFSEDKNDITDEMGQAMAMMIMEKIRERLLQYQEETGNLYNFEATPGEGCLRADTKVLTIDGPKPIGDLVDQKVPLLSFNRETKKLEYKSGNIFFDSVTSKVYRITFDNGYTLECTSEHPFAVRHWNGRDGEEMYWSPASSLKVGDRIKSVYTRFSQRGYKKYGKDFFEHREKWKFFNGEIPDGCVIHHKDFDKLNNDIDNLEMLTDKEHRIIHSDHLPKGPGFGENNHFFGKKHTEESRRKISEARSSLTDEEKLLIMEAYKHGLYANQIARMMNMTSQPLDYLSKCGFEARELSKYPAFNKRAILYLFSKGYNDREIVNILRGYNKLNEVRDVLLEFSDENHKVVSIEVLNKKMPVYNASVEDNQNFFVGDDEHGYVLTHNTTYRFAKEDIKRFPDIIQAGVPEAPYYTNSSQLPATFGEDVFDALDHQDELQKLYTGGTVLHIYSQEDLTGEQVKSLIRKVLSNYRLPYVSFTASFSTCPKHGRIPGLHQFCPLCDAEILAKHGNEEA